MTTTAQFRHERQHGSKLDRKAIERLEKKISVVSRRFEKKFERWYAEVWYKGTKEYRLLKADYDRIFEEIEAELRDTERE